MLPFPPTELESYLDEALPPEEMARIEKAAREDGTLVRQLASIHARRSAGIHSLGEIWRQRRLSCPTREQLGSYLLSALDEPLSDYIDFHVEVVGCSLCRANLADLRSQQAGTESTVHIRRRKYFQSSAGYLKKGREPKAV
jgi:hypothetical protein